MKTLSLIVAVLLLATGCKSNDCTPTVQVVKVNVPIQSPAPTALVNLVPPQLQPLPIKSPNFSTSTDYDFITKSILESVNLMEQHIKLVEEQNAIYREYINSLPKETK